MLDTVIRGGTIIDGTGAPASAGDLGIADGKIVALGGRVTDDARNSIDADGALVVPASSTSIPITTASISGTISSTHPFPTVSPPPSPAIAASALPRFGPNIAAS